MTTNEDDAHLLDGLRPEFTPALLNDKGREASAAIRRLFSECLNGLERVLPEQGRARSLAITKLQESCMWAIREVALYTVNTGSKGL